jgi:hypothetical protein
MAVLTPIPSPRDNTTTRVNRGDFPKLRMAKRIRPMRRPRPLDATRGTSLAFSPAYHGRTGPQGFKAAAGAGWAGGIRVKISGSPDLPHGKEF